MHTSPEATEAITSFRPDFDLPKSQVFRRVTINGELFHTKR